MGTNIDRIKKIIENLIKEEEENQCSHIEDADAKKECEDELKNSGTDKENQCTHIEGEDAKKECEDELKNSGTDSVDLLNIDEIININNITNIDRIEKIIENLIKEEEENQCSHIKDEDSKKF